MNKGVRKALWYEFRSDIYEYGFLDALNRLNFEIGYHKTAALSPEREKVYNKYILRKKRISKLKKIL